MTEKDYNSLNSAASTISSSAIHELQSIKKEKLRLSERIAIERSIAKLESLRTLLSAKF